jgi:hypothetical protein
MTSVYAPAASAGFAESIVFRCPPELESVLPRPTPAVLGLPDWFKTMPQKTVSTVSESAQFTVKKCPPFIDAMTYGFLMPLVADLRVENGEFAWDRDVPGGALTTYPRSPISFHDTNQVVGTPFFEEDRFLLKFNNFWTIVLPPGYSLLVSHPFNRPDLPFTTLTGLVDCDQYIDNFIHFPSHWHDTEFAGVLKQGTPVAQCVPIKRETFGQRFETITGDAARRLHETASAVSREQGVYRRQFRAPKR